MRYIIKLSYSGADFCGWQRQPGAPSVQETLENALHILSGAPIAVTGAGRTDTGVSAVGYIAHFESSKELDTRHLLCKLNAILPASVVVHDVSETYPEFHARFDARRREYTYFVHRCKDPFIKETSLYFSYPDTDFEIMNKAAALLIGTHDFSCFQKSGSDNKTTICTVFEAEWRTYTPSHVRILGFGSEGVSSPAPEEESGRDRTPEPLYWYFRIAADRFLRNMVRAIVGTLLEVGRGKRTYESFAELIIGGSRKEAGESSPGHALFLSKIKY